MPLGCLLRISLCPLYCFLLQCLMVTTVFTKPISSASPACNCGIGTKFSRAFLWPTIRAKLTRLRIQPSTASYLGLLFRIQRCLQRIVKSQRYEARVLPASDC
ncbi:hypothetical protein CW304_03670 [Bacillus sp. UFRGS-B20]|nr:hypothetical protein CW304_03670 [Bacillus sp. UFRGS-B20]